MRPSFCCPECGHVSRYAEDARTGHCPRCREYTGQCGAGSRLYVPGFTEAGDWQAHCTQPWTALWELTAPCREPVRIRLCEGHEASAARRNLPPPWRGTRLAGRPQRPALPSPPRRSPLAWGALFLRVTLLSTTEEYAAERRVRDEIRERRRAAGNLQPGRLP